MISAFHRIYPLSTSTNIEHSRFLTFVKNRSNKHGNPWKLRIPKSLRSASEVPSKHSRTFGGSVNIHRYFPPLRWIIVNHSLVCKTQWTHARVITFPAKFGPDKIHFLSLAIHWFGIYWQLFTSVSVNNKFDILSYLMYTQTIASSQVWHLNAKMIKLYTTRKAFSQTGFQMSTLPKLLNWFSAFQTNLNFD